MSVSTWRQCTLKAVRMFLILIGQWCFIFKMDYFTISWNYECCWKVFVKKIAYWNIMTLIKEMTYLVLVDKVVDSYWFAICLQLCLWLGSGYICSEIDSERKKNFIILWWNSGIILLGQMILYQHAEIRKSVSSDSIVICNIIFVCLVILEIDWRLWVKFTHRDKDFGFYCKKYGYMTAQGLQRRVLKWKRLHAS